jgi:glutamate---cysteine ligase / carboxylate-amine ligase
MEKSYRFGIEEEYFLSDIDNRGAVRNVSPKFIAAARAAFPGEVQREMLQSQIEVATQPCHSMIEARQSLAGLRAGLSAIGKEHGLTVLAAGTHPSAIWARQKPTAAARYDKLMRDLQMLGSRNQVCGLHVHVEVLDVQMRVSLMTRMMPYLPLILALSTSSPFWQAQRTGLMGYRLAAYNELPRTGLPELFESATEYQRYVDIMVEARAIQDSSFVWWAVRPSQKHPTLELRVADSCTRLADTMAIAALFRCLVRRLENDPNLNADLTTTSRAIASENMWRAQRYGIHGGFVCEQSRTMRPVEQVLAEVLALLAVDAAELDCVTELSRCRDILLEGTSADVQLAIFEEARVRESDKAGALSAVVDWLARETRADVSVVGQDGFPITVGTA